MGISNVARRWMRCRTCGSPLEAGDVVYPFCGVVPVEEGNSVAHVPVEHQKGRGAVIQKTREDSLVELAEGLEVASHAESRSHTFHRLLPKLVAYLLIFSLLGSIIYLIGSQQHEAEVNSGMFVLGDNDFDRARERFRDASFSWFTEKGEGNFLRGVSYFLEWRKTGEKQDDLLWHARTKFENSGEKLQTALTPISTLQHWTF